MRVIQQTTLARQAQLSGVALHSGVDVRVVLRPASADSGVIFRRVDMDVVGGGRNIEATPGSVVDTRLCTRLGNGAGLEISTVEHLLAALSFAGIDNVIIDVDGPELPILDGSAARLLEVIGRAGLKTLAAAREAIRIMAPIEIVDGDRFIRVEPFEGRRLELTIDFEDAAIGRQNVAIDLDDPADVRRLSHARTFCRVADVEAMRSAGLARGGTLENAIVVDGGRVLNPAGLRDPQEFALHKALDLIGDLRLAGVSIIGAITAHKCGHDLNTAFAKKLRSERAGIERVVLPAEAERLPA